MPTSPTIIWGKSGVGYCAYCNKRLSKKEEVEEYYNAIDQYAYQGHKDCVFFIIKKELHDLKKKVGMI